MATQFRVFRGAADDAETIAEAAGIFTGEIEGQGGEYVESHSALGTDGGSRVVYTLTVVYREKEERKPGQAWQASQS